MIEARGLAEPGFEVLEAFQFLLREAGRRGIVPQVEVGSK